MFLYFLAESQMRLPRSIATLATMAALCVAGYLITTLAKEYGIEKTGRLGVGAKTIFGLLVMSWILVGAYALVASYGKEQIHLGAAASETR
jgi:ABC-type cobalamin transport system permease subunit